MPVTSGPHRMGVSDNQVFTEFPFVFSVDLKWCTTCTHTYTFKGSFLCDYVNVRVSALSICMCIEGMCGWHVDLCFMYSDKVRRAGTTAPT